MHFAFISTNFAIWGGADELWSQAAQILADQGNWVSVSVYKRRRSHPRVEELRQHGIRLHRRPVGYAVLRRGLHELGRARTLTRAGLQHFLSGREWPARKGQFVVISDGGALPPVELLELCVARNLPFVNIGQSNSEHLWFGDDVALRYRRALPKALRCYFVSEANWRLTEMQIGAEITNGELVRNPFNVSFDAAPPWPLTPELRLASVARLHPPSKGQDVLLSAMAGPPWDARDWRITFYGEGPSGETLRLLAERLGLSSRVAFAGHVDSVVDIWAKHHALVLPSRYEGLPLALVEAMLCGRPAIVTDVAGHTELVEDGVTGFVADCPTVPAFRRSLEDAWEQRSRLQEMGKTAAGRIRELVPANPAADFADKLRALASAAV